MRHERPDAPSDRRQTRTTADTARLGRDTRDSSPARDTAARIRAVRAALRFLDRGRVDKARQVLNDLLDSLGRGE